MYGILWEPGCYCSSVPNPDGRTCGSGICQLFLQNLGFVRNRCLCVDELLLRCISEQRAVIKEQENKICRIAFAVSIFKDGDGLFSVKDAGVERYNVFRLVLKESC